ncbi:tyrosine-protein phosphatase [Paenibacillus thermotolerans]|uniref:tyrosine-protein phosphatase n=1 Tax=Paenibacillus thermotolerans TaxID=3027807 RepID=UPI002367F3CA|nr:MULTISPECIES: CpsB/CapC family capsule biosynthesis tyrosine phosphatase [unclassified Paenibacillus]
MIDIHCHILPGLDDGAGNEQEALDMARHAVDQGIRTIIATPHHADGFYHNDSYFVHHAVRSLNATLQTAGIPLTVLAGQEIRMYSKFVEDYLEGRLVPLSGSQYVLIEISQHQLAEPIFDLFYEMQVMGLTPVIAHPERNAAFVKKPDLLFDLVERGALCQLTAHSITGYFGKKLQKLSFRLCKQNLIHFVASDAHHAASRGFQLKEAYEMIRDSLGNQYSNYYIHNAECLVANRSIEKMQPVRLSGIHFSRFFAIKS